MKECDAPVSNRTVAEKGLTGRMRKHLSCRAETKLLLNLRSPWNRKRGGRAVNKTFRRGTKVGCTGTTDETR